MTSLALTILGASPAAPNTGGACSAYLVRHGETSVLLDCGPGSAGRIAQHVPVNTLDAVFISHFHPDHYFDLVQVYYLLKFGPPRAAGQSPRTALCVPPGGRAFLDRLGQHIAGQPAMLEDMFAIEEYSSGGEIPIGDLRVSCHPVQHYVPSHALRVESDTGATLVFSSDVAPCPQIVTAAKGCDLFLCESALLDPSQDRADPSARGHMTAREAASTAQQAGAKRLLITHYRSGPLHDEHHLTSARQHFTGPIDLAHEGATYTVA
ncbi:MAG: MBL fold metallo-hydrolase [Chloroflexota bacterium]